MSLCHNLQRVHRHWRTFHADTWDGTAEPMSSGLFFKPDISRNESWRIEVDEWPIDSLCLCEQFTLLNGRHTMHTERHPRRSCLLAIVVRATSHCTRHVFLHLLLCTVHTLLCAPMAHTHTRTQPKELCMHPPTQTRVCIVHCRFVFSSWRHNHHRVVDVHTPVFWLNPSIHYISSAFRLNSVLCTQIHFTFLSYKCLWGSIGSTSIQIENK